MPEAHFKFVMSQYDCRRAATSCCIIHPERRGHPLGSLHVNIWRQNVSCDWLPLLHLPRDEYLCGYSDLCPRISFSFYYPRPFRIPKAAAIHRFKMESWLSMWKHGRDCIAFDLTKNSQRYRAASLQRITSCKSQ